MNLAFNSSLRSGILTVRNAFNCLIDLSSATSIAGGVLTFTFIGVRFAAGGLITVAIISAFPFPFAVISPALVTFTGLIFQFGIRLTELIGLLLAETALLLEELAA